MTRPDLNLLVTLDVLLTEGSVARAARRLQLSPSAMSRALSRLREATGDPLLVRAGRVLVPTPRALELRTHVGQLVQDAETVLRPVGKLAPRELVRTFTLRTSEGFVENFGPVADCARQRGGARGDGCVSCRRLDKDSAPLREGTVDLETGVLEANDESGGTIAGIIPRPLHRCRAKGTSVEQRSPHARPLRLRPAHQRLTTRGPDQEPMDEALASLGLDRRHRCRGRGWFFPRRIGAGQEFRPDRDRTGAAHRKPPRGSA